MLPFQQISQQLNATSSKPSDAHLDDPSSTNLNLLQENTTQAQPNVRNFSGMRYNNNPSVPENTALLSIYDETFASKYRQEWPDTFTASAHEPAHPKGRHAAARSAKGSQAPAHPIPPAASTPTLCSPVLAIYCTRSAGSLDVTEIASSENVKDIAIK